MADRQLFGTDGIRGRAGTEPMTPELGVKLGRAIAYVARRGGSRAPRIVIGKDTRLSGYMLDFIEMFAPHLDRRTVTRGVSSTR